MKTPVKNPVPLVRHYVSRSQTANPSTPPSRRTIHEDGDAPGPDDARICFVFGSNLAGIHGRGAAKLAQARYGARRGIGEGHQGRSYAIPTKDGRPGRAPLSHPSATLSVNNIDAHIRDFAAYARAHPEITFFVTRVGCGLAGYTDTLIAPIFGTYAGALPNLSWPAPWKDLLDMPRQPLFSMPGINIYSGEKGLGAQLTNPTVLARNKGKLSDSFEVMIGQTTYPDTEHAYKAMRIKGDDAEVIAHNDALMVDLIGLKLLAYPQLEDAITRNGGEHWLEQCTHLVGVIGRGSAWEGAGRQSRFIRCLIEAYRKVRVAPGEIGEFSARVQQSMLEARRPPPARQGQLF